MDYFRMLFTGSRRMTDEYPLICAIRELREVIPPTLFPDRVVIVHGAARGLDTLVDRWAKRMAKYKIESYPAEDFGPWPACGPKRNSHMVSLGAAICFAFPDPKSRGTWDCLEKAVAAGIPTRIYPVLTTAEQRSAVKQ